MGLNDQQWGAIQDNLASFLNYRQKVCSILLGIIDGFKKNEDHTGSGDMIQKTGIKAI